MFLSLAIHPLQQGGSSNGAFFTLNRVFGPSGGLFTRFWRTIGSKVAPLRGQSTLRQRFARTLILQVPLWHATGITAIHHQNAYNTQPGKCHVSRRHFAFSCPLHTAR
ncbi:hypothetical protein THS27_24055 [Thalassospira sp. MCCC 1A01428]|nr:hypothetical protein THS27_24055 [Thalassospira sp. MCCC 1A01428]